MTKILSWFLFSQSVHFVQTSLTISPIEKKRTISSLCFFLLSPAAKEFFFWSQVRMCDMLSFEGSFFLHRKQPLSKCQFGNKYQFVPNWHWQEVRFKGHQPRFSRSFYPLSVVLMHTTWENHIVKSVLSSPNVILIFSFCIALSAL